MAFPLRAAATCARECELPSAMCSVLTSCSRLHSSRDCSMVTIGRKGNEGVSKQMCL